MTAEELAEVLKAVNANRPQVNQTMNFGNTALYTGTNERYGLQTNGNLWREKTPEMQLD